MRNREVIFWTSIIALIGGGILYVSLNKNQSIIVVKNTYKLPSQISSTTSVKKINTVIVNNTQQAKSYTLSDVSGHNNQSSCWTVIDGKIYDITSFIYSHPAGVQKILEGCGKDATNLYGRVGAHDIYKLSNFVIGTLK